MIFNTAEEAFEYYYNKISKSGVDRGSWISMFDVNFKILNPLKNNIETSWRKFNTQYAQYEWQWYLSGNRSGVEISKKAKIWEKCMDKVGNVNSNYGWHWRQGDQLQYVIDQLKQDTNSRRASISIYDAKGDRHNFENDTPCTYAINFRLVGDCLNMSVMMRSNDLWYGFCNDQYCFSKLQEFVAKELNVQVGYYNHFANDLHLYKNFLNKNK